MLSGVDCGARSGIGFVLKVVEIEFPLRITLLPVTGQYSTTMTTVTPIIVTPGATLMLVCGLVVAEVLLVRARLSGVLLVDIAEFW